MNRLDEHDITKSMLNIIREGNFGNKDTIDLDGGELKKQQNLFRNQVTSGVEFGGFKLYPNSNNAVFTGKLTDYRTDFQMTLNEEDGLFINASQTKLSDEAYVVLGHLRGFYKNWKKEWQEKMQTEYKAG